MILEIKHWFTEDQKAMWELMSSIATTLAAIATFVTVREMRKGRKDLITPDLFVAEKNVIISSENFNKQNFFFLSREYMFDLYNLGNGPAKDVKAIWEFDLEEMIDNLGVEKVVNRNDILIVQLKEQKFLFDRREKEHELRLNFVLGKEKVATGFNIISMLMRILELRALVEFHKNDQPIVMFKMNPKDNPTLKIEYLDTLGKRRVVRFDLTIGFTVFREENSNEIKSVILNYYFQRQNNVIFKPKEK